MQISVTVHTKTEYNKKRELLREKARVPVETAFDDIVLFPAETFLLIGDTLIVGILHTDLIFSVVLKNHEN